MEVVFSADNGFEAHNILNLLNQAGIAGRVEGELLQGAFGELPPAIGMVRVLVRGRGCGRSQPCDCRLGFQPGFH